MTSQYFINGPEVKQLEAAVAEYSGCAAAVGVSSGTDALLCSLMTLGVGCGDEVITTPYTFFATAGSIWRTGAKPVFVDIEPDTFNIDPAKIEAAVTDKTKAIMPVHLFGQVADMDAIMAIADKHKLLVIEDAAQAIGASYNSRKAGSIGTVGCFSFFPSKNLGGFGDGGMVSTNDDKTAELVRMLIKHGGKDKYNVDHIGYNARLDTLQAAVLLVKFRYLDEFNAKRREIAGAYIRGLSGVKELVLPLEILGADHVYHQFTVRVTDSKRDILQKALKEVGISTMVYYPVPLHKMKVFDGTCEVYGDLSNSLTASKEVLSLPVEPLQTEGDTTYILEHLNKLWC